MGAALQFRNVTVGYDRHRAEHYLDGEVANGALVAVVGPNGADKSTLFKAVGLLKPRAGRVERDANAPQDIACLPQTAEIGVYNLVDGAHRGEPAGRAAHVRGVRGLCGGTRGGGVRAGYNIHRRHSGRGSPASPSEREPESSNHRPSSISRPPSITGSRLALARQSRARLAGTTVKGHGMIHRLSEDIDIRIEPPPGLHVKTGRNHSKQAHVESRRNFSDWPAKTIRIGSVEKAARVCREA